MTTKIKTLRRPGLKAMDGMSGRIGDSSNFFSDFRQATIELRQLTGGAPLPSRLVSEHVVRRLREKIRL